MRTAVLIACLLFHVRILAAEPLHALVIGNTQTADGSVTFEGGAKDARDVAERLRALGFDVSLSLNDDATSLSKKIRVYADSLHKGDRSVIFFAGSSMSVNGDFYLLPADFRPTTGSHRTVGATELSSLLHTLGGAPLALNMIVLNGSRMNPWHLTGGKSRFDATEQTVIAFATAPGLAANAGSSTTNSAYARALLTHLRPDGDVEELLKAVREEVVTSTDGKQVPWMSSSLRRRECLVKCLSSAP